MVVTKAPNRRPAVTAHWIDDNWKLNSITLGCKRKEGRATANDHVAAVETMMGKFSLSYKKLVANVTDTEATMIAAGRILVDNSLASGGKCVMAVVVAGYH